MENSDTFFEYPTLTTGNSSNCQGKVRIVGIYIASKLIFAIKFYSIPLGMSQNLPDTRAGTIDRGLRLFLEKNRGAQIFFRKKDIFSKNIRGAKTFFGKK